SAAGSSTAGSHHGRAHSRRTSASSAPPLAPVWSRCTMRGRTSPESALSISPIDPQNRPSRCTPQCGPRRIWLLLTAYPWGGLVRVLRISHSATITAWRGRERALRALGHDVTLITARRWHAGGVEVELDAAADEQVRPTGTAGRH